MTVSLGRPRYMSKDQVKALSDAGHAIGSHTWDHHNVKKYQGDDWKIQIEKPSKQLEEITGKPIRYFAYPFGLWNPQAIPELKKRGMVGSLSVVCAPRPAGSACSPSGGSSFPEPGAARHWLQE